MDEFFDPFDDAELLPPRVVLARLGYAAPAPETLEALQIRGRLWELIYALAARRTYLHDTDHLDDRELYAWLHQFLDEPAPHVPPAEEWNHHVEVSEQSTGSTIGIQTWLRYYADESERRQWARDFPQDKIPPRERRPHDRDRLLPEPPSPPPVIEWVPPAEEDPLGLANVDRAIGANTDAVEADEIGASSPDETGGQEHENWQRPIDHLARQGAAPIPPAELTEETVTAKLWELLHSLACRGFYVQHTDHLSDHALYTALWEKGLREEAILPGNRSRSGAWFHDFIGSYGPEDMDIYHRYYESAEHRTRHFIEYPDDTIPPRETPPFTRDWRLPQGPF